jgi:hypothetical protein
VDDVVIVCPTHNRAGVVSSFAAFGPDLLLCVAESQLPKYKAAYPEGRFDVHPDDVIGTSQKRDWMWRKYGSLFMVDDDINGMMRDFSQVPMRKVPPAEAYDIVQRTADMAAQMGAVLWGLQGTGNPMGFQPQRPFKVSPGLQLGCAMGLHPSDDLFFPKMPWTHEDVFISGLNAYHHRFQLQDLRYGLEPTYKNTGGRASLITDAWLTKAREHLQESFGEAFDVTVTPKGMRVEKLKVPW